MSPRHMGIKKMKKRKSSEIDKLQILGVLEEQGTTRHSQKLDNDYFKGRDSVFSIYSGTPYSEQSMDSSTESGDSRECTPKISSLFANSPPGSEARHEGKILVDLTVMKLNEAKRTPEKSKVKLRLNSDDSLSEFSESPKNFKHIPERIDEEISDS
eukprot:UN23737